MKKPAQKPLPAPRLELNWGLKVTSKRVSKALTFGILYERTCEYRLILPLKDGDIRRETKDGELIDEFPVLISTTKISSSTDHTPVVGGEVGVPYRDGFHAQWDSKVLGNLPIFAIFGDVVTEIVPQKGDSN